MSFMRMLGDDGSDEVLDYAQEKAFEAVEAPLAGERIALAREAPVLAPLCADAYLVLAQEAAGGFAHLKKSAIPGKAMISNSTANMISVKGCVPAKISQSVMRASLSVLFTT